VNLAAPNPLPQREFMATLRAAFGKRVGFPASKWMVEIGAAFMKTDTELILKSRRVVPKRLVDAGFFFKFPTWDSAAVDLVQREFAGRAR
jgi:NAD dependent epimerase/dehydratase family enzyme